MKLKNFFALLVSVGVMTTAQAAQAWETFSVDNGSNPRMALNTNNGFRLIDGNPRMSLWQSNNADPDQQFNRLPGNRGGILLQHRTTGKCLNAYRVWNGAEINVWNCDANDPDQNFNVVALGGGYNLIKRANTNFCVDSPTRDNAGKIHLWDCNSANPNQRWLSSGYVAPPPSSTIGIPVNWSLAAYRQNNAFWQSGYAPASFNPPVNSLNGALGNCTWYANGRLQQLGYSKYALDSMLGHAHEWDNTASRGVTISSTPRVGAIAQWDGSKGNHVAVVEQVNSDGTILISESSYYTSGTSGSFLYRTRTIASNNPSRYLIVPR